MGNWRNQVGTTANFPPEILEKPAPSPGPAPQSQFTGTARGVTTPVNIFEWWLVSDWLANRLREFEQPVLATDYGAWWGRTCTGQAIKMDYVIRKIVESTDYAKYGG